MLPSAKVSLKAVLKYPLWAASTTLWAGSSRAPKKILASARRALLKNLHCVSESKKILRATYPASAASINVALDSDMADSAGGDGLLSRSDRTWRD